MKGYPRWFYGVLLLTMTLLVLSGLLLTPTLFDLRLEWDMPWRLQGDGQIAVAAVHAGGGFWMLMLVGSLWNVDMRAGWRHRRHWRSGIVMAVLMLLLAVSALGIYYFANEQWALAAALAHLAAGALLVWLFVYHAVIGYQHAVQHRHHPQR